MDEFARAAGGAGGKRGLFQREHGVTRGRSRLGHAGVSEIDIERAADKLRVTIYTSRPGIIIGRRGAEVDKLRDDLQKQMGREVHINIQEIQRPELDAQLVAESIAGHCLRAAAKASRSKEISTQRSRTALRSRCTRASTVEMP